jgi:hypothetical protein
MYQPQLTQHPHQVLNHAAKSIFSQDMQDSVLLRTRRNLGEISKALSDDQVETIITEFQFLIGSWLDEYEKELFNGMTLREVVNNE